MDLRNSRTKSKLFGLCISTRDSEPGLAKTLEYISRLFFCFINVANEIEIEVVSMMVEF